MEWEKTEAEEIKLWSQLHDAEENNSDTLLTRAGTRWRSWLKRCTTSRKVAGSIPDGVIGIFHWCDHYDPGVHSASNRNEYQEYFLGVKATGA